MKDITTDVRLTGILLADQWSKSGHVTGIAIYTDGEDIIRCARNELLPQLFDCIHKRVLLDGELTRQVDGRHFISAKAIQLLEDDDTEETGI
jgi:hypothetical protein